MLGALISLQGAERNTLRALRSVSLSKLNWGNSACALLLLCVTTAIVSPAQTLTTIRSFDNTDGNTPDGFVQATNGELYGTAYEGGANGDGTIFKITVSGTLTTLLSLDGSDGSFPFGLPLVQAPSGDFYGTLQAGGADLTLCGGYGCGTFFKITPSCTLTTLYSFCSLTNCTDGSVPLTNLVQATNGDFYGTTSSGGANCIAAGGCGTVFKITPSGALTTLYSFCSQTNCTDGEFPFVGLIQASNGNFYGTALYGGANGYGAVFKLTPSGTLTTLHSFDNTDGSEPLKLVQATNGDFYGTTAEGGANTTLCGGVGCGTLFRITQSGTLITLHSFDGTDGSWPHTPAQATDGNFYGTTKYGGANTNSSCPTGCGTIFKITPSGKLTTLYSFCAQSGCTDGIAGGGGPLQDTNGKFYGSTDGGGTSDACPVGCGTIYSLAVGLGPFVETQTTSGRVGAAVKILGTNLTGATSVTFNDTSAVFKVVSSSLITTTVPSGATTGFVTVTTPKGTLKSNTKFRVTP